MNGQQGDVLLFQSVDNGDIEVVGGVTTMTGSFETAAYLSMFGGNKDDDGSEGNPNNWWGNLDETVAAREYRSETQFILKSLPATSNNLRRVEDAAGRDLNWFLDLSVASSVTVVAVIPELNHVQITVTIEADGDESKFTFVENWKAGT